MQANQAGFTPEQQENIEVLKAYFSKMSSQDLAAFIAEVIKAPDSTKKSGYAI